MDGLPGPEGEMAGLDFLPPHPQFGSMSSDAACGGVTDVSFESSIGKGFKSNDLIRPRHTVRPPGIRHPDPCPQQPYDEKVYLERLEQGLTRLETFKPADLAIVVWGADPYEYDELPSASELKLSLDQLMTRDRMVYDFLKQRGIPAAFLMAGGYGDRVWEVFAQFLTWALLDRGFGG